MKFFLIFEGEKWKKNYFFLKFSHCYHFQTLSEKDVQYFCRHGYSRLVKNSLHMFRRRFLQRNFLEGLIFFPHFQKSSKNFSEFWRENFGRVVTTTFIHVHRNIFRKVIFLSKSSKFFFVVFGIWAANVWTLKENFLLTLSRLHSPLLKNHFSWKK